MDARLAAVTSNPMRWHALTLLHRGHLYLDSWTSRRFRQSRQIVCWQGRSFCFSLSSKHILHCSISRNCSSNPAIAAIFIDKEHTHRSGIHQCISPPYITREVSAGTTGIKINRKSIKTCEQGIWPRPFGTEHEIYADFQWLVCKPSAMLPPVIILMYTLPLAVKV